MRDKLEIDYIKFCLVSDGFCCWQKTRYLSFLTSEISCYYIHAEINKFSKKILSNFENI